MARISSVKAAPPPPAFIAQGVFNGSLYVQLRAPQFGNPVGLVKAKIIRYSIRFIAGPTGVPVIKIARTAIVASGLPGDLDGKVLTDDHLPCGLYLYAAQNDYGSTRETTLMPIPVQIP